MTLSLVPQVVRTDVRVASWLREVDRADVDLEVVGRLDALLRRAPARLTRLRPPHPLLRALRVEDAPTAAELCMISALLHADSDERDTAEYLLRHRGELVSGTASSRQLMVAAKRAAECDARRARWSETPVDDLGLRIADHMEELVLVNGPSVAEIVVQAAEDVLGRTLTYWGEHLLANAVVVALGLGERHRLNGGTGPSLVAMRPSARRPARLVTHLRLEFGDPESARAVARLLVGSDGAPIESALLWWTAQAVRDVSEIPETTRRRWTRDLATLEAAAQRLPA